MRDMEEEKDGGFFEGGGEGIGEKSVKKHCEEIQSGLNLGSIWVCLSFGL